MRKISIILGVVLAVVGAGITAYAIMATPPPREALPVLQGRVVEMWRYMQRGGTDFRIQIAPDQGEPRTVFIALDMIPPGLAAARGRNVLVRHASDGRVMEMIVEGRPVIDYATTANKRAAAMAGNRWVGFGVFLAGVAIAAVGLVFGRR